MSGIINFCCALDKNFSQCTYFLQSMVYDRDMKKNVLSSCTQLPLKDSRVHVVVFLRQLYSFSLIRKNGTQSLGWTLNSINMIQVIFLYLEQADQYKLIFLDTTCNIVFTKSESYFLFLMRRTLWKCPTRKQRVI